MFLGFVSDVLMGSLAFQFQLSDCGSIKTAMSIVVGESILARHTFTFINGMCSNVDARDFEAILNNCSYHSLKSYNKSTSGKRNGNLRNRHKNILRRRNIRQLIN